MTKTASRKKPQAAALAAPEHLKLAEGEIYRGATLHEGKLAHLIELPGEFTGTHAEATKWAKEQGGELPSRIDGIVLFDGKCGWASAWYWLAPQRAVGADYAWFQLFSNGYQYWFGVSDRGRARAVRRVPIQ